MEKQEIKVSFDKCHGCNNLLPKDHYCLKYLRGVETAVYLCPFYCHWANDEERRTDEL